VLFRQLSSSGGAARDGEPGRVGRRKEELRAHPAVWHDRVRFYQTLGAKSLSLSFIHMPDLPAPPAQCQIEREPLPPSAKSSLRVGSTISESRSALATAPPTRCDPVTPAHPHRRGVVPLLRAYSRGS
jgi:hypothetical protein